MQFQALDWSGKGSIPGSNLGCRAQDDRTSQAAADMKNPGTGPSRAAVHYTT